MNTKLTPKYWACWVKDTNDIHPKTLSKSLTESRDLLYHNSIFDWDDIIDLESSGLIEFILISIERVHHKGD